MLYWKKICCCWHCYSCCTLMLCTHSNTDGNKGMIFSGIACTVVSWRSAHSRKSTHLPIFDPISCIGSKFIWMSTHLGVSFATQPQTRCISEVRNFVILHWRLLQANKLHNVHGDMVPFRVLCAVRTRLWSCWWFCCTWLFFQLFALRASSHCKYDMGTLSQNPWKSACPIFGRLVSSFVPRRLKNRSGAPGIHCLLMHVKIR